MTSDPGERRPLTEKDIPEYWDLIAVMREAQSQHKQSVVEAPNMFAVHRMMWRPWAQPFCNFPNFQCDDPKFRNL
jgi:steryl-sulfatase/arylsulfatase D/F/H